MTPTDPAPTAERRYIITDRHPDSFGFVITDEPLPLSAAVEQARTFYPDENGDPSDLFLLVPSNLDGNPTPEALADLNGGEWVQPENVNHIRPWWDGRTARMRERRGLGVGPLFVFVPRKATDGDD